MSQAQKVANENELKAKAARKRKTLQQKLDQDPILKSGWRVEVTINTARQARGNYLNVEYIPPNDLKDVYSARNPTRNYTAVHRWQKRALRTLIERKEREMSIMSPISVDDEAFEGDNGQEIKTSQSGQEDNFEDDDDECALGNGMDLESKQNPLWDRINHASVSAFGHLKNHLPVDSSSSGLLEQISSITERFLMRYESSEKQQTLAVVGVSGAGKTFFLDKFIQRNIGSPYQYKSTFRKASSLIGYITSGGGYKYVHEQVDDERMPDAEDMIFWDFDTFREELAKRNIYVAKTPRAFKVKTSSQYSYMEWNKIWKPIRDWYIHADPQNGDCNFILPFGELGTPCSNFNIRIRYSPVIQLAISYKSSSWATKIVKDWHTFLKAEVNKAAGLYTASMYQRYELEPTDPEHKALQSLYRRLVVQGCRYLTFDNEEEPTTIVAYNDAVRFCKEAKRYLNHQQLYSGTEDMQVDRLYIREIIAHVTGFHISRYKGSGDIEEGLKYQDEVERTCTLIDNVVLAINADIFKCREVIDTCGTADPEPYRALATRDALTQSNSVLIIANKSSELATTIDAMNTAHFFQRMARDPVNYSVMMVYNIEKSTFGDGRITLDQFLDRKGFGQMQLNQQRFLAAAKPIIRHAVMRAVVAPNANLDVDDYDDEPPAKASDPNEMRQSNELLRTLMSNCISMFSCLPMLGTSLNFNSHRRIETGDSKLTKEQILDLCLPNIVEGSLEMGIVTKTTNYINEYIQNLEKLTTFQDYRSISENLFEMIQVSWSCFESTTTTRNNRQTKATFRTIIDKARSLAMKLSTEIDTEIEAFCIRLAEAFVDIYEDVKTQMTSFLTKSIQNNRRNAKKKYISAYALFATRLNPNFKGSHKSCNVFQFIAQKMCVQIDFWDELSQSLRQVITKFQSELANLIEEFVCNYIQDYGQEQAPQTRSTTTSQQLPPEIKDMVHKAMIPIKSSLFGFVDEIIDGKLDTTTFDGEWLQRCAVSKCVKDVLGKMLTQFSLRPILASCDESDDDESDDENNIDNEDEKTPRLDFLRTTCARVYLEPLQAAIRKCLIRFPDRSISISGSFSTLLKNRLSFRIKEVTKKVVHPHAGRNIIIRCCSSLFQRVYGDVLHRRGNMAVKETFSTWICGTKKRLLAAVQDQQNLVRSGVQNLQACERLAHTIYPVDRVLEWHEVSRDRTKDLLFRALEDGTSENRVFQRRSKFLYDINRTGTKREIFPVDWTDEKRSPIRILQHKQFAHLHVRDRNQFEKQLRSKYHLYVGYSYPDLDLWRTNSLLVAVGCQILGRTPGYRQVLEMRHMPLNSLNKWCRKKEFAQQFKDTLSQTHLEYIYRVHDFCDPLNVMFLGLLAKQYLINIDLWYFDSDHKLSILRFVGADQDDAHDTPACNLMMCEMVSEDDDLETDSSSASVEYVFHPLLLSQQRNEIERRDGKKKPARDMKDHCFLVWDTCAILHMDSRDRNHILDFARFCHTKDPSHCITSIIPQGVLDELMLLKKQHIEKAARDALKDIDHWLQNDPALFQIDKEANVFTYAMNTVDKQICDLASRLQQEGAIVYIISDDRDVSILRHRGQHWKGGTIPPVLSSTNLSDLVPFMTQQVRNGTLDNNQFSWWNVEHVVGHFDLSRLSSRSLSDVKSDQQASPRNSITRSRSERKSNVRTRSRRTRSRLIRSQELLGRHNLPVEPNEPRAIDTKNRVRPVTVGPVLDLDQEVNFHSANEEGLDQDIVILQSDDDDNVVVDS